MPNANALQSVPVKHIAVGDLSVGYRIIGSLARTGVADSSATGTATPLLMVMGSSGTMDLWSPAFVSALAHERQIVVFDNRGIGETNDPAGSYPFSQLADDTAGLIGALGYDRLDVLGWSMGGDVVLDLAVRHPDVVGRLISYAGNAGGALATAPSKEVLSILMDTSGTAQQHGQRLLELLFPQAYRAAHPGYLRTFPIPTETAEPAAIGLQNKAIGEWPGVSDRLENIACATLFVTGTEDELTPPDNALMMAERVPGSWLMRFCGAGHGLMYQDPEELAASVLLFLNVTASWTRAEA